MNIGLVTSLRITLVTFRVTRDSLATRSVTPLGSCMLSLMLLLWLLIILMHLICELFDVYSSSLGHSGHRLRLEVSQQLLCFLNVRGVNGG